jgi:hypothetical protein
MPPVLEGADAIDAAKVTPGKINYAERMYGHKSCSHSNIFSIARLRSRRVLFICLSYLDESTSTAKAWSIVVSCENRCPTGLTQYRLEQEGDKVVVKRRHVTRQKEMLILISLENFVTLQRLMRGETLAMSFIEAFKMNPYPIVRDFGMWMNEPGFMPDWIRQPATLTEELTWTWLWQVLDVARKQHALPFNKPTYTLQMMADLVHPIATKFSEIMQREDRSMYGANKSVRANPERTLQDFYLPAYKIGEICQKRGRLAPLPPRDPKMTKEEQARKEGLGESVVLPDGPEGTNFGTSWALSWGDIGMRERVWSWKSWFG